VVSNVAPPAELNLPRLTARPAVEPHLDEVVKIIEGDQATPREVLGALAQAHEIEFHTHGVVDAEVSDVASLVLSGPQRDQALLLATDLQPDSLKGRPGVVLGACTAAQPATYGALARSLPLAFLRAGASWVMASPNAIEDAEAPLFFENIWKRIRNGATPVLALYQERHSARWQAASSAWIKDVLITY
jgi:CHAT domain-containing protein